MAQKFTELRKLRRWADLTQAELAEKAGVSKAVVEHAETGRHEVRYGNLVKIANALGVDVTEILPKGHALPSESKPEAEGHTQYRTARSHVGEIGGHSSVSVTVNLDILRETLRDVEMGIVGADAAEERLLAGVA
jgi:putative transcriptional regulator